MTRRVYSSEYKREAVKLVTVRGVSVAQAAKDLDVHATVLRRWVKEFGSGGTAAFPGNGQLRPEDEEIRSLRREVTKLKAERDILKKGAAYFARDHLQCLDSWRNTEGFGRSVGCVMRSVCHEAASMLG